MKRLLFICLLVSNALLLSMAGLNIHKTICKFRIMYAYKDTIATKYTLKADKPSYEVRDNIGITTGAGAEEIFKRFEREYNYKPR
ncbi:MAG: hypothetical protein ACHQVS_03830 [Candidatus Babeliales bacterium]